MLLTNIYKAGIMYPSILFLSYPHPPGLFPSLSSSAEEMERVG